MARSPRSTTPESVTYLQSLPPREGGSLLLALWVNAVATLVLYAARFMLVARVLQRMVRTGRPAQTAAQTLRSRGAIAVLGASVTHAALRKRLQRRLEPPPIDR
jgi:hypothetical protein